MFPCRSKEGLSSLKWTYETMNEGSHGSKHEKEVQSEPKHGKQITVENLLA